MVLRNHVSRYIDARQAIVLIEASVFAFQMQRPFNKFISIHLEKGQVEEPHDFITRFLKLVSDWMRRQSVWPAAWSWVLENPPPNRFGNGGGLNAHILLHVPPPLQKHFSYNRQKRWAKRAGAVLLPTVYDCAPITGSRPADLSTEYLENLYDVVRYMLKGVDPAIAQEIGIDHRDQGRIWGKRVAASEALGEQYRTGAKPSRWDGGPLLDGPVRVHSIRTLCPQLWHLQRALACHQAASAPRGSAGADAGRQPTQTAPQP